MRNNKRHSLIIIVVFLVMVSIVVSSEWTFPKDFTFGAATAAYQIEGSAFCCGKGKSIWDVFTHQPNTTYNGENGDVADDHYNRVASDVELMSNMGLKNYRMSIAWSRILPDGTINSLNQEGIDHYNREINMLNAAGIDVYVTLYHWDLPQALEEKYNGWLNKTAMRQYFVEFADVCFKNFGDRVKHWITLNEPWVQAQLAYGSGGNAPGRCTGCRNGGNSATEPYIAAHSQLIAHAAVVDLYRTKYQKQQEGVIGITLNSDWNEPLTDSPKDVAAAQRYQEFQLAWFADPVTKGDYPESMRERVKERLPRFTAEEQRLLIYSYDFLGLNHYTSRYISDNGSTVEPPIDWYHDSGCLVSIYDKNGKIIGEPSESPWLYVVPWGMRKLLNWIDQRYNKAPLYITENGVDVPNENNMPIAQALNDEFRVKYLQDYLAEVSKAVMIDNCNIKGYFVWSLMDNFEWADGYSKRFGINYVDYKNGLTRYTKKSAIWYSQLIQPYH